MGNKFVSIKVILIFFAFLMPIQCKKRSCNRNVDASLYNLLSCNTSKGNINLDSQIFDTVNNNHLIKKKSNLELIDDDIPLKLIDTLINFYLNRHEKKDIILIDSLSCYFDGYVSEYFYLKLNEFNDIQINMTLNDMFILNKNKFGEKCLEHNFILCYSMYGRKNYILTYIDNYINITKDENLIKYLKELRAKIKD